VTARPLRSTLRRESASHSSGRRPPPGCEDDEGLDDGTPATCRRSIAPGVSWKAGDTIAIGDGRCGVLGVRDDDADQPPASVRMPSVSLPSPAGTERRGEGFAVTPERVRSARPSSCPHRRRRSTARRVG
jgi:hypothetical protein